MPSNLPANFSLNAFIIFCSQFAFYFSLANASGEQIKSNQQLVGLRRHINGWKLLERPQPDTIVLRSWKWKNEKPISLCVCVRACARNQEIVLWNAKHGIADSIHLHFRFVHVFV